MADHLTEEEQIESIKRWWNENWLSIVLPIVLAILAYTGWNYWTDHNHGQAQEASDRYQELTTLLQEAGPTSALSDEQKNQALSLAEDIRSHFSGGMYADLSAMILAKLYVEDAKLSEAEAALRDVVDSPANESIQIIAKARLAKVLLELDQHSEALALVAPIDSPSAKALYAETRGDIYLDQGETAAANTAYQEAIDSLTQAQGTHRGILQFKLDGTRVEKADKIQPAAEPVSEQAVEAQSAEGATDTPDNQE